MKEKTRAQRYAEVRAKQLETAETYTVLEPDGSLKEYIKESVISYDGSGLGIIADPPAPSPFNHPGCFPLEDSWPDNRPQSAPESAVGYCEGVIFDDGRPTVEDMTEPRS